MANLLNTLVLAANIFFGGTTLWIFAAILALAAIYLVVALLVKCEIVYVDPKTDYEIYSEKCGFGEKVNIANANKTGMRLVGWSYDPKGNELVTKSQIRLFRSLELYAVWEKDVAVVTVDDAKAVLEFTYVDEQTNEELKKEVHPLAIDVPVENENGEKITGWAIEPDVEPVLSVNDGEKAVLSIQLYPVYEAKKNKVTEIPEEVVEEAPVEEPVVEEVVEEAPAEEPVVEEVVEEAPAEEPVVEEVVEEAPAEEPVVEEVVEEAPAEEPVVEEVVVEAPAQPTIIPTYIDGYGNEINIKYSRSFKANVIQGDETVKQYYSDLKNHILSYKGVKSRISWKFDSFNRGRDQLFKLKIRGKSICLYCALDPNEFEVSKYHHEAMNTKLFEDVPMLVKVKSQLGLKKSKELVDITMNKFDIEKDEKAKEVDYVAKHPYEDTEALIEKKLIKVLSADDSMIVKASAKEEVVDEKPVVEEVVVEAPVEEPVAEEVVVEAPVEEPVAEEVVEEAPAEDPVVEEVVEEVPAEEPVAEEVVEEVPAEDPVIEEVVEEIHPATTKEEIQYVQSVTAEEVDDLVIDEVVDSLIEEDVEYISKDDTKKAIVNVDVLSREFNDGDVVCLASLKEKGLIEKKSKSVKVLARGTLDKALTVKASEFSETALKMIVLTGGTAVHTVSKIK